MKGTIQKRRRTAGDRLLWIYLFVSFIQFIVSFLMFISVVEDIMFLFKNIGLFHAAYWGLKIISHRFRATRSNVVNMNLLFLIPSVIMVLLFGSVLFYSSMELIQLCGEKAVAESIQRQYLHVSVSLGAVLGSINIVYIIVSNKMGKRTRDKIKAGS